MQSWGIELNEITSEIALVSDPDGDWRAWLRRRIVGLLLIKLLVLTGLWWLFFSAAHRPVATADTVAARLIPTLDASADGSHSHD